MDNVSQIQEYINKLYFATPIHSLKVEGRTLLYKYSASHSLLWVSLDLFDESDEESFSYFAFIKNVPDTKLEVAIEACYDLYYMQNKYKHTKFSMDYRELQDNYLLLHK